MTREQARKLAPIIAAYGEGKEIEVRDSQGWWHPSPEPSFTFHDMYRIVNPDPVIVAPVTIDYSKPLELGEGKRYERRTGHITKPLVRRRQGKGLEEFPFTDGRVQYSKTGYVCAANIQHEQDLVGVVIDPVITAPEPLVLEAG